MSKVGQIERITQNKVIKHFKDVLQYEYLGNWEKRENNSNIEWKYLEAFLQKQGYSAILIQKVKDELFNVQNWHDSLYDNNKKFYSLLHYGVKVRSELAENNETIWLIDWKNPHNNYFAIAEEVSISGKNNVRPDIILYVNGIALGVIELKRSTVNISEGIRQNLRNQGEDFIAPFFTTMQIVMSGNETQGLFYGTIETSEKYYLQWKKEENDNRNLYKDLEEICSKERLIEIIHDFVVFDKGIKKLCRHNQYFGIKSAQDYIKRREGGIIWHTHTQGSGKSLTMVWLTKWIRENIENARVLIITDRTELDEQIEKVFKGVNEDIHRTKSGDDLVNTLNESTEWLVCSLVHKFGNKEDGDVDGYLSEIQKHLTSDFKAKGNIFVFVDECHRTQSGKLHDAMKLILPNAVFIGFTGTPLLKKDKKKSIEVFGNYIHTYKFDEAVNDKVVLDLIYEARNIEQNISSQEKIDQWFEVKTKGLTEVAQQRLKQHWGTLQKVLSSKDRLEHIIADILMDFEQKERLQNGQGNAMLIAGSIYQACRYYEIFQQKGFTKCAIVTSYEPNIHEIKDEFIGEEGYTERKMQFDTYVNMLKGKKVSDFEVEVKRKFINEPAQMKLLIVVDKLLTGFDAPSATYLYIDKKMQDHGLFQAICRVNRLDGESKEYGYIIDYKDLFKSLENSINDYTKEAFGEYESDDVEGLLKDRLQQAKERLEDARDKIKALCEGVPAPQASIDYQHYFCGNSSNPNDIKEKEQLRVYLYKYTVAFIRSYANIANEIELIYSIEDVDKIKQEVSFYTNLRDEIGLASGDYIDLKRYEPAMRHLIDSYIRAEESEKISEFSDLTLIKLIVERGEEAINKLPKSIRDNQDAVAETIANNLIKTINTERPNNPKYFDKMSTILYELVEELKRGAINYKDYLKKIVALTQKVVKPDTDSYPKSLNTNAKRALYDYMDKNESLALAVDRAIKTSKQDGFRGNPQKENLIKKAIYKILSKEHYDAEMVTDLFNEVVKNQNEY